MTLDCLWRFKLNLRLHLISLPRLICASVRSSPIVIHGPDRSVGLRCFWIGLGSVRSKFILESVRSDSISKIVGPADWTEPYRDRTDVVHPCCAMKYRFTASDFHRPNILTFSRDIPAATAEFAAPLRKEWPE